MQYSIVVFNTIVLTGVILGAEPDHIKTAFDKAKAAYEFEIEKARQEVLANFDRQEDAARKKPDLEAVNTIKARRAAFEVSEDLQSYFTPETNRRLVPERKRFIAAYETAIKGYLIQKKDNEANRLDAEFKQFKDDFPPDARTESAKSARVLTNDEVSDELAMLLARMFPLRGDLEKHMPAWTSACRQEELIQVAGVKFKHRLTPFYSAYKDIAFLLGGDANFKAGLDLPRSGGKIKSQADLVLAMGYLSRMCNETGPKAVCPCPDRELAERLNKYMYETIYGTDGKPGIITNPVVQQCLKGGPLVEAKPVPDSDRKGIPVPPPPKQPAETAVVETLTGQLYTSKGGTMVDNREIYIYLDGTEGKNRQRAYDASKGRRTVQLFADTQNAFALRDGADKKARVKITGRFDGPSRFWITSIFEIDRKPEIGIGRP